MVLPVRQQVIYWGIAALVFLAVLWVLGSVILPFVVGGAIAYFLDPVADRLQRAGLSRVLATSVISIAMLLVAVALVLALNFVLLRARPEMPIPLVLGLGAVLAGATGWAVTGPAQMTQGAVWAIAVCGLLILPVSFFSLSVASRHTHASNVSLLLLLETVLGPLWVWLVVGERPTPVMLAGGAVVVGSLALYLWQTGRRRMALQR